jgi:hypothetical protein
MNIQNIIKAAEVAKTRTTDARWINAINRAVEAVSTNAWIVTELHDRIVITSDSDQTYTVNGSCNCRAGQLGQPCKHAALRRLMMRAEEMEAAQVAEPVETKAATSPRVPTITRSIERDYTGARVQVVRCNGWLI